MPSTHTLNTICYDSQSKSFVSKATRREVGPNDVLIRTTHSGLCTTDVHAKGSGCGLGHEGIGIVEEVGENVTKFMEGDRAGWGWLHSSCQNCKTCVSGYRQYCAEARGFAFSDHDQGALSDYRIINAAFAYLIPPTIPSLHAAPLMCAGASTYEALQAAGTKPSHSVGVVGIGGLGHVAIMFARAMGCEVTAISSGRSKIEDAFNLGADWFRSTDELVKPGGEGEGGWEGKTRRSPRPYGDQPEVQGSIDTSCPSPIDVLLITSNAVPDLGSYLPILARRATIVLMTIQQDPVTIPYMPFVLPGHRLIASTEASLQNHLEMLDFVAVNKIRPWVEKFDMDLEGVARAFDRLESGQMRYRGVLVREE